MKEFLKTALCLLLCALLPIPALAGVAEEMEGMACGDYTYTLLEDGGACITNYTGDDVDLAIPAELDGHPVREIGDDAFSGCASLATVTLPDSLTSLGINPFNRCNSLSGFSVSPGHPVFAQIDGVLYEKATKTLVRYPEGKAGDTFAVPDGILAIGGSAFLQLRWPGHHYAAGGYARYRRRRLLPLRQTGHHHAAR